MSQLIAEADSGRAPVEFGAATILIVDDDPSFAEALAARLRQEGTGVTIATTCDEALRRLTEDSFDIVLTDLMSPERKSGLALLETIQVRYPKIQSILMSVHATARDYEAAQKRGSVAVLNKPFTHQELKNALHLAVECRRGFHGTVHGLSLVDLLQMFHFARRTISVEIDGTGLISVEDGEVVHAEYGDLMGEDALQAILNAPVGSLCTGPLEIKARTIDRSVHELLLDLLRMSDEDRSGEDELDEVFAEEFSVVAEDSAASKNSQSAETFPVGEISAVDGLTRPAGDSEAKNTHGQDSSAAENSAAHEHNASAAARSSVPDANRRAIEDSANLNPEKAFPRPQGPTQARREPSSARPGEGRSAANALENSAAEINPDAVEDSAPHEIAGARLRKQVGPAMSNEAFADLPPSSTVFAVRPSDAHATVIRGPDRALNDAAPILRLTQAVVTYTDKPVGTLSRARGGVGMAILWNQPADFVVVLVEKVSTSVEMSAFRARSAALAQRVRVKERS